MKRKDYEVFYIFEMLAAAKKGVGKKKLRDSVSCNGIKFKLIFSKMIQRCLLESDDSFTIFHTTDTGRALLEQWHSIMTNLGLSEELCQYM